MRQIATIADADAARKFVDYLLTRKIDSRVIADPGGHAVWICDEDQVGAARQELTEFAKDPGHPRYDKAVGQAQALRKQEERAEKDYARRQSDLARQMAHASFAKQRPVTLVLLLLSLTVTLATNFGKAKTSTLLEQTAIAPFHIDQDDKTYWFPGLGLQAVRTGQVWRLVAPIFLHLNPMHLLFNMLMLLSLGGGVESATGKLKYLLLVLLFAVTSNLAEYYLSFSFERQPWLSFAPSPFFGGMSGVLYGLFGFAWMKSRYEPEYGLNMSTQNVAIMLGWLVICMIGAVGPIANVAHLSGLLVGVIAGYAPRLWRRG